MPHLDRRRFLTLSVGAAITTRLSATEAHPAPKLLRSPHYSQVTIASDLHRAQQRNTQAILMGLSDDSLLKPFREMSGDPAGPIPSAPGVDLGGWYGYLPTYNYQHGDAGFAPGHCFGQWTSALARASATSCDPVIADRVRGLHAQLRQAISPAFFDQTRFPAYTFDKFVCGLMDAHALLRDPHAFPTLDTVRLAALPSLPGHALEREIAWRAARDKSFFWDENYILPENLYLVAAMGAGPAYRALAQDYLLDSFFTPLARNQNVLGGLHAYSHVNALCSAMQAYFVDHSARHLQAAVNGFRMLEAQSYATGGWAPDELLEKPGSDRLYNSLTKTHNSFETPCGAYAHMKLTRYLLQATRDGHYGDSMERIMLNAALGARPMQGDGHSFYYADFGNAARRIDSVHRWPCCSGTLPQLAADYGINAYLLDLVGSPSATPSAWVNLYFASTLRWSTPHARLELEQEPGYPETDLIRLHLRASRPTAFSLHLRIPEWAQNPQSPQNPQLAVNGQPHPVDITLGFAKIDRLWRSGDLVELHLPMQLRLDPLQTDAGTPHPEIASLLHGPRVLMAMTPMPSLTRRQLLSARRVGPSEWAVDTPGFSPHATLAFKPFTHVGDDLYSAQVRILDA